MPVQAQYYDDKLYLNKTLEYFLRETFVMQAKGGIFGGFMANSRPCKLGISLDSGGISAPFILVVSTETFPSRNILPYQGALPFPKEEIFPSRETLPWQGNHSLEILP